jgi:hypothetical protein
MANGPAHAARLLGATVELDGRVVLSTAYEDDSNPYPERVWRYLGREPLWADVSEVSADPANPARANLRGPLLIRIRHTTSPIVESTASELTLVRKETTGDRWFLPEGEVERIAQANGIPRPALLALSEGESWRIAFVGGGLVLITGLGLFAVWRVGASRRAAAGRRGVHLPRSSAEAADA